MFVLGTAGHVDHGKSALVQALTGIDPDRLSEEKERGMTIDLGFAWLRLPSGREVSLVDVPGHERFIKNMLAGVAGIDLALLVVAADEGVMPQTREHLDILDLLQVKRGVVVITKKDLVDDELLELVSMEIKELLETTSLAQAPIVSTSAVTGEGLPELLSLIDEMLALSEPRRDIGRPRLPIDRVFTMTGFGTVVTGTLVDGTLSVGQEVEIVPRGIRGRLRGLQTHKTKVEKVGPGRRVAANISGLDTTDISRGDVLTSSGWLVPTKAVDVSIRLVPGAGHSLRHNSVIGFHSNTLEVESRVRLLDKEEIPAGEEGWAQLSLARPVAVVKGDFFIVRSPTETLGGGVVIDAYPRRHRRFHGATLQSLASREKGGPAEVVQAVLEAGGPAGLNELVRRSSLAPDVVSTQMSELASDGRLVILGEGQGALAFSATAWARIADTAREMVAAYHRRHPLRPGLPKEELKSRVKIPAQAYANALRHLVQTGVLNEEGKSLRLPDFRPELDLSQKAAVDRYLKELARTPYAPSSETNLDPEVMDYLVEQRQVVRLGDNVVFPAQAYNEMVDRIVAHTRAKGKITVAEVRDLFGTSRKYALAIMEHLDETKVTRRVGDERVLR